MKIEKRKHNRISEIGKVESQDLCIFPGVLVDVSKVGCRVRFPTSFLVDTDIDYEMKLSPVRHNFAEPLYIIARPIWQKTSDDSTEIGFTILHSPSSKKFDSYIDKLLEEMQSIEFEKELLNGIKL